MNAVVIGAGAPDAGMCSVANHPVVADAEDTPALSIEVAIPIESVVALAVDPNAIGSTSAGAVDSDPTRAVYAGTAARHASAPDPLGGTGCGSRLTEHPSARAGATPYTLGTGTRARDPEHTVPVAGVALALHACR